MKLSEILVERFGGEVPSSRAALESLPGVGRKTANVVLNTWFKLPAMAVDTHIFRVANRTGIAPRPRRRSRSSARSRTRCPAAYQLHAHHWLILHGRYVCTRAQARLPGLPDPRPLRLRGEDPVTKRLPGRRHRQRPRRRDRPYRRRLPRRQRRREGHHAAHRHAAAPSSSTATWARRARSPAARRPTPSPGSPRSARAPPTSARSRTTSSASIFAHDLRAQGADYATPLGAARPSARDRPLHDPGHRRRRAVDEHLPRRFRVPRARRHRRGRDGRGRLDLPRGLPLRRPGQPSPPSPRRSAPPRSAGGKVAITLSDPFCVERHRDDFLRDDPRRTSSCWSPTSTS